MKIQTGCVDISLIIPVFNAENTLPYALASLRAQTLYPQQIIFVDNASTDRSRDLLEGFQKEFTGCRVIILTETKKGPSAARNCGIRQAGTSLLGFFDSDMSLHPDWTRCALDFFNRHPEIDAVAGVTDGHPEGGEFQKFQSFYRKDFAAGRLTHWPDVFGKGFLTFANAACRASLFDKAGLLPEAYCVGEDLYLNIQALKNGAFIMISEASLVSYHYEKYDLFTFLKSRYRYRTALARVLRDLLPGTLVFRHGSSRSFPLTIWIGNPAWLAGLFLLPGLLLVNPLLLFTGPAWVYLFNCLLVLHRGRSRALGLRRTLYYAWLQSLVSCALFAAQAESLIRYGVVTL